MTEREPDPGFHVRDRRGRTEDPVSPPEPTQARTPPASRGEPTLVGLFMMLGSLAAAALEGVPDPGGQVERDLRQAADMIDMLGLLREKTEGRRTPEETKVLEEVIYGLQLRYVEATRHPG